MLYLPPETALDLARQRQQQMIDEAERDRQTRAVGAGAASLFGRALVALVKKFIPGARQYTTHGRLGTPCATEEHAARESSL
jgi:hypothetical protein